MSQEYKLFLGCLIPNRLPFLEKSAKYVFEKIGLKTSAAEFGCCPNPVGLKFVDEKSWYALSARNIAIAEEEGKPIMSLCNGCYQSLAIVDHDLKHDDHLKTEVNGLLKAANREYKGTINIEHFVVTLAETVGLDHIKGFITRSLEGLKVALHPGCHYARPSHILKVEEDVFDLKNLRNLAKLTGVEVVDYEQENLCCGNVERQTDEYTANMMLKSKFDGAIAAGADMILVNCPACYQQFDGEQRRLIKLEEDGKLKYKVPILYITELFALAMGASPAEIGLNYHRNKPKKVLAKVNL